MISMKPVSLQSRIFSYGALFVSVVAIIIGISFYFTMSQGIEQQIGDRALSIAKTTADRPDVRAGFEQANPSEALQPIAEAVRLKTEPNMSLSETAKASGMLILFLNELDKKWSVMIMNAHFF